MRLRKGENARVLSDGREMEERAKAGVAERAKCSAGTGGGCELLAVSLIRLRAVCAVT